MKKRVVSHRDLEVYEKATTAAMEIFELSKGFPKEETYALTDQMRRSSRSVCANLAEGWRKRRYEKAFISKLSDAEGEAAEDPGLGGICGKVWVSRTRKRTQTLSHL